MKKLAISVLLSSSLAFGVSASTKVSANVKFVGDIEFASFCEAVVNDDLDLFKAALNTLVGDMDLSEKRVFNRVTQKRGVKCDGQSLIEFSQQRSAAEISSFILSKKA